MFEFPCTVLSPLPVRGALATKYTVLKGLGNFDQKRPLLSLEMVRAQVGWLTGQLSHVLSGLPSAPQDIREDRDPGAAGGIGRVLVWCGRVFRPLLSLVAECALGKSLSKLSSLICQTNKLNI